VSLYTVCAHKALIHDFVANNEGLAAAQGLCSEIVSEFSLMAKLDIVRNKSSENCSPQKSWVDKE